MLVRLVDGYGPDTDSGEGAVTKKKLVRSVKVEQMSRMSIESCISCIYMESALVVVSHTL